MTKYQPKIFYESKNGRKRMEVIDKNPWSEKKKVGRAYMLVPKWTIGIGSICGLLILTFLIASIVFALKMPRPSLYGESCEQRTCLPDNGMVCINKTCSCLENQYYATRCLDKKNYGEKCSRTVPCKDGTNMVCRDGVCKCLDVNYWYNSSCIAKKTFKQPCTSNNECLTSLMLNCDLTSKTCICNNTRYWDGVECQLKRTINETCKKTSECIESQMLQCSNGTCKCNSTGEYWDTTHLACYPKLYENTSCTAGYQCYSPMTCNNTYCMCAPYQYHNLTSLSCINQKLVNQPCSVDFNCRVDKGLECNSGTCQCLFDVPVWSSTLGMCIQRRDYGETVCANQNECQLGKNLICYLTGPSNCSCPLTRRVNMCDCYRVYGNESYWNGAACTPALINGSSCENASTTYQCQSLTQGTICNVTDTGDYICQCPIYKYLDVGTNKCLNQELESGSCSVTIGCRVDLGLYCSSGVCVCNSTYQFWSTTLFKCVNYKTYAESCNPDQCDPRASLSCNSGTTNNCTCPTYLAGNKCDCTRLKGNENYWNGSSCVPAAAYGGKCIGTKTYQCQTLAVEGVACDSGICQCPGTGGIQNSTMKCISCATNWKFVDPNCYRVGFNMDKSDQNAHNGEIDKSCGKSALVDPQKSTCKLATLNTDGVVSYFKSIAAGKDLWVDLSGDGKTSYYSDDSTWSLTLPNSEWGGTNTVSTKDACVYYTVSSGLYYEQKCDKSPDHYHACQYTP